jgi:hypothetical protein
MAMYRIWCEHQHGDRLSIYGYGTITIFLTWAHVGRTYHGSIPYFLFGFLASLNGEC